MNVVLGAVIGAAIGLGLWWFLIKDWQRRRFIRQLEKRVKAQLDEQRRQAPWN